MTETDCKYKKQVDERKQTAVNGGHLINTEHKRSMSFTDWSWPGAQRKAGQELEDMSGEGSGGVRAGSPAMEAARAVLWFLSMCVSLEGSDPCDRARMGL